MADPLDSALDLMRRLPPEKVQQNLSKLIDIVPDLTEDLLAAVDQPLKVDNCKKTGKSYLLCDYNRDADSFRSPWTNDYQPPLDDGAKPSDSLRKLEIMANDAFDTYREMYFEGGVSSVYMWDLDDGFAAAILIKKTGDAAPNQSRKIRDSWDSIHVLEVTESSKSANYKLTSTVMLYMLTEKPDTGDVSLSGSLTRQVSQELPLEKHNGDCSGSHVVNMGHMVEDMEFKLRHSLQEIYFGKTKDIVNDLRSIQSLEERGRQVEVQRELNVKLSEQKK